MNLLPKPTFLLFAFLLLIVLLDSTSAVRNIQTRNRQNSNSKLLYKPRRPVGRNSGYARPRGGINRPVTPRSRVRPPTPRRRIDKPSNPRHRVNRPVTPKPHRTIPHPTRPHPPKYFSTSRPIGFHIPSKSDNTGRNTYHTAGRPIGFYIPPKSNNTGRYTYHTTRRPLGFERSPKYNNTGRYIYDHTTEAPQSTRKSIFHYKKRTTTPKPKIVRITPKPNRTHQLPKYYYNSNDPRRNHTLYPQPIPHKSLLPVNLIAPPITSCGMTLCTNVITYPTDEITNVVERVRQFINTNTSIDTFKDKSLSLLNFTSKFDDFWYGQEAPDHGFIDNTTNCREHVNTYYPLEGSAGKRQYYVVNIPSLKQGLTNIECESSFQMCSNTIVPAGEMRECRQMYRKEELLVLPYKQSRFEIKDFKLKMFRVPTGCACMASI